MNFEELKAFGIFQQKQKGLFVVRIKAVAGDFSCHELNIITKAAKKFGDGKVHLTTRQGIEIHNVKEKDIENIKNFFSENNITLGASGPRGRGIVACPGALTCKFGLIETKELAKDLDDAYFRIEAPAKFKISVTGCPNNCAKANENDIGVMGAIIPKWEKEKCINCGLCLKTCPVGAIEKANDNYSLELSKCINCGRCINVCPVKAWIEEKRGYILFLGGTMGKKVRLGTKINRIIASKEELFRYIRNAFDFFKRHGQKKERFGHVMDRIGLEKALKEIIKEKKDE